MRRNREKEKVEKKKTNQFIHRIGLAFLILCSLVILNSGTTAKAASAAKTWKIKVNGSYQAELIRKKGAWYFKSDNLQMKDIKAAERVLYIKISSKSGLSSGYYYFTREGQLDERKVFHNLDTRIGKVRLKGKYYFGDANGRLHQKAGWTIIKGRKYALNKMGKMYHDR